VIVGGKLDDDRDVEDLQKLARDLGISHRMHFWGARPQEELPMIYSAADATVIPSYHESFGLVAVESLACGTPVVATRAGGLTTSVPRGTLLVSVLYSPLLDQLQLQNVVKVGRPPSGGIILPLCRRIEEIVANGDIVIGMEITGMVRQ